MVHPVGVFVVRVSDVLDDDGLIFCVVFGCCCGMVGV